MKRFCFALTIISIFCASAFAQSNQIAPCPGIIVTGPATLVTTGETAVFTANVANGDSLKYIWTVSRGTIVEGQNSPVIKVATTPDDADSEIIATVEIKGLPEDCTKTASETAKIGYICKLPIDFDDYGKTSFKEEKERLANVAKYLTQQPGTTAFFIIHFPENRKIQLENYTKKIKNYLIQTLEVPSERLTFVYGESETQRTRIVIVPNDALLNTSN